MARIMLVIALPTCAPLPVSFVLHLLRISEDAFINCYLEGGNKRKELEESVEQIARQVETERQEVFALLRGDFSSATFKQVLANKINAKPLSRLTTAISERHYSISNHTLRAWKEHHLLIEKNLDRYAAILIMAALDTRRQGFLPNSLQPEEPQYWCYARHPFPHEEDIWPCPLPLQFELLPVGTILYSPWSVLQDGWILLSPPEVKHGINSIPLLPMGSMRFASMNYQTLASWNPTLKPTARLIFGNRRHHIQQLEQETLYRLGPRFLSTQVFPPKLPLVVDVEHLGLALTQQSPTVLHHDSSDIP